MPSRARAPGSFGNPTCPPALRRGGIQRGTTITGTDRMSNFVAVPVTTSTLHIGKPFPYPSPPTGSPPPLPGGEIPFVRRRRRRKFPPRDLVAGAAPEEPFRTSPRRTMPAVQDAPRHPTTRHLWSTMDTSNALNRPACRTRRAGRLRVRGTASPSRPERCRGNRNRPPSTRRRERATSRRASGVAVLWTGSTRTAWSAATRPACAR